MEPSTRKPVLHPPEQRLLGRLSAPEPVNPHLAPIEVHLRSDQAIQPADVHLEPAAEQFHDPRGIGPSEIDDPAPRPRLEVQPPSLGDGPPSRGRLDPVGAVATMRGHEPPRLLPSPPGSHARTGPTPWPATSRCTPP
jgi:hypothetical protein